MRLVLVLIALVAAVVLAVQNATPVTLNAFMWRLDASLAVVIVLGFAIGAIVAVLALLPALFRARQRVRRLQARVAELEALSPSQSDTEASSMAVYPTASSSVPS